MHACGELDPIMHVYWYSTQFRIRTLPKCVPLGYEIAGQYKCAETKQVEEKGCDIDYKVKIPPNTKMTANYVNQWSL